MMKQEITLPLEVVDTERKKVGTARETFGQRDAGVLLCGKDGFDARDDLFVNLFDRL